MGKLVAKDEWSITVEGGSRPPIDFASLVARTDLRALIADDLGPPQRAGRWPCPFHGGEHPNLGVDRPGLRWRCFVCSKTGTALDWLMEREGITVVEAARRLDPSIADPAPRRPRPGPPRPEVEPPRAKPAPGPAWQDPAWQAAVAAIIGDAEASLWARPGRPALDRLRSRGLDDQTIRRFRLGFNPGAFKTRPLEVLGPDSHGSPRGIHCARGVTIPWVRPGSWYSPVDDDFGDPGARWVGCNVRRLADDFSDPAEKPKYLALAGSERGHPYPWFDVSPGCPAMVCEGEMDALTAWQEVGHVVNVITVGGAAQNVKSSALNTLAACPDWLLMFDHDANHVGDKAAVKFSSLAPRKCRRLWLPAPANDLNDFHRDGGNILAWLESEWVQFGWRWPLREAAR